jgi:phosphoglycerate dehydrogenase-like enzyme
MEAPLHVYLAGTWEEPVVARLRELAPPGVRITAGDPPPDGAFDIVVGGRPSPDLLRASPRLRALVIPFAGVPSGTKELLAPFPGLAVHNLHHNAPAVAEMAVALLLAAAKRVVPFDRALRNRDWSGRYQADPSLLLEGRTALVLGYGAVGRRVARACRGLGMNGVAVRRSPRPEDAGGPDEVHPPSRLRDLLPRTHALLVCLPRTPETDGMIGAEELALLPPGAVLVNIGRGAIVREEALYRALKEGRLGAAGLDVWYRYPKSDAEAPDTAPSAFPFHDLDNVVMSPHRAGHVAEDDELRMRALAELLSAAARGEPMPNRVDLEAGY